MNNQKEQIKSINIPKVGKLILSDKVKEYIDCLHKSIGETEWSGMLFYKLESGDIKQMKDLIFKSDFIYPRDIGSSVYTETTASGDVADAYDIYPDGIECSTSLVHSHHSMSCFFSSTDTDELITNAKLYNYYISLIVNFNGKYCAKIAFPGKQKTHSTITLIDADGSPYEKNNDSESDIVFVGDLDVEYNDKFECEEWLSKKINELQEAKTLKSNSLISRQNTLFDNSELMQFESPFSLEVNSIGYNSIKNNSLTGKRLLAELVVCSPDSIYYSDKSPFIAQDLKFCCENEAFGNETIDYIISNFTEFIENIFDENNVKAKNYVYIYNDALKELMIYNTLYADKYFFKELKKLFEINIEELKLELNYIK